MDYSAANPGLWNPILQLGIIAIAILVANLLRRKIPAIRSTLLPAAVLGGFLIAMISLWGLCFYIADKFDKKEEGEDSVEFDD